MNQMIRAIVIIIDFVLGKPLINLKEVTADATYTLKIPYNYVFFLRKVILMPANW